MKLPSGFQFSGVRANIKKSGLPDLALITTDQPAIAAGVYTQNVVRAASIDWNRQLTPCENFRGLVINSGNANACTGEQGVTDNRQMATELANRLNAGPVQVAVLSTGVIGKMLPMPKIVAGIDSAFATRGRSPEHFAAAAQAIMTTDRSAKTAHAQLEIDGQLINFAAMAKGAGMIGPNMATMLAIVTTDARLDAISADRVLKRVADQSFNCISVEGHTSTNDALILIASGMSAAKPLVGNSLGQFESALTRMAVELAKQIPADGEGATHLISISVDGAANHSDADRIGRSIANSPLVKCAITGSDPNWGRIVSAAGYCGVALTPHEITLLINRHEVFRNGAPTDFDAKKVSDSIKREFETKIELTVGTGSGVAQHWTSDLTVAYVRFNSEYTT